MLRIEAIFLSRTHRALDVLNGFLILIAKPYSIEEGMMEWLGLREL